MKIDGTRIPKGKISLRPGNFKGLNMPDSSKKPQLGGGMTKKPSKIISKALGMAPGMPMHQEMVQKLLSHPDTNVVSAAKKLLKKY